MRLNSARPIRALTAKEQDGLREMLLPAKQPDGFMGSETDDRPDPYRDSESPDERKLFPAEIDEAESVFGDTINFDEVRISDKSLVGRVLGANRVAMTIENTIYGHTLMSKELLVHELTHVWQYKNDQLSPVKAGLWQLAITALRQRGNFYRYSVKPKRRNFREYNFEQQASIMADAYRVLVKNEPPIRNANYESGDPLPKELYDLFLKEFREWHEELQPGSPSSTEEEN